jgi:hypothetical protein
VWSEVSRYRNAAIDAVEQQMKVAVMSDIYDEQLHRHSPMPEHPPKAPAVAHVLPLERRRNCKPRRLFSLC